MDENKVLTEEEKEKLLGRMAVARLENKVESIKKNLDFGYMIASVVDDEFYYTYDCGEEYKMYKHVFGEEDLVFHMVPKVSEDDEAMETFEFIAKFSEVIFAIRYPHELPIADVIGKTENFIIGTNSLKYKKLSDKKGIR